MHGSGGAFWLALKGSGSGDSIVNGKILFLVKAELINDGELHLVNFA